jgi:hypothetical protein
MATSTDLRPRIPLALCAWLLACGGQSAPAAAPEPTAPAPAAAPTAPTPVPAPAAPSNAAPPGERAEDPTFELTLARVGEYAAGKLGNVAITLKPRGVYHINQEYPVSVKLEAGPELALAKTELKKGEAVEVTEQVCRFDVPLTPKQAGTHTLTAHVKFAVCTEENCVPDERTLALALSVQ